MWDVGIFVLNKILSDHYYLACVSSICTRKCDFIIAINSQFNYNFSPRYLTDNISSTIFNLKLDPVISLISRNYTHPEVNELQHTYTLTCNLSLYT